VRKLALKVLGEEAPTVCVRARDRERETESVSVCVCVCMCVYVCGTEGGLGFRN